MRDMTKALEALERLWKETKINPYARPLKNRSDYDIIKTELERLVPKRPTFKAHHMGPECTNCGCRVNTYYSYTLKKTVVWNFCAECGHALDWEESSK